MQLYHAFNIQCPQRLGSVDSEYGDFAFLGIFNNSHCTPLLSHYLDQYLSLSSRFKILPVGFLGRDSINSTDLGAL
jgi:hypothetical protein